MLGGACDLEFEGATFEEVAQQSQVHGKEMAAKKDKAHLQAIEKMKELMAHPGAFEQWYAEKKAFFDTL